jgi:hypothetical protein
VLNVWSRHAASELHPVAGEESLRGRDLNSKRHVYLRLLCPVTDPRIGTADAAAGNGLRKLAAHYDEKWPS